MECLGCIEFMQSIEPGSLAAETLEAYDPFLSLQDCRHENVSRHFIVGMYICKGCGIELHEDPRLCAHLAVDWETMHCNDCHTTPDLGGRPSCDHPKLVYNVLFSQLTCEDCTMLRPNDSVPSAELDRLKKVAVAAQQNSGAAPSSLEQEVERKLLHSVRDTPDIRRKRWRAAVYLIGLVDGWVDDSILPQVLNAEDKPEVRWLWR